jgi:hypothetical protein
MDQDKGNPIARGARINRAGLEANVRNVRALLDQTRQSFGPETRRAVDALIQKTDQAERIEETEFSERLDPAAWLFVALSQQTEILNALVVHLETADSTADAVSDQRIGAGT